jgi:hypothetical protein
MCHLNADYRIARRRRYETGTFYVLVSIIFTIFMFRLLRIIQCIVVVYVMLVVFSHWVTNFITPRTLPWKTETRITFPLQQLHMHIKFPVERTWDLRSLGYQLKWRHHSDRRLIFHNRQIVFSQSVTPYKHISNLVQWGILQIELGSQIISFLVPLV